MPVYDNQYCDDTDYGIGHTPQSIVSLRRLGVPIPDQPVYVPAAVYYTRGDYTRVGDGFPSANWIWDIISIHRLEPLLAYVTGTFNGLVYVRTDRRTDGRYPNPRSSFAVFQAIMWLPVLSGQEGVPVARSPYAMQTVGVQFKRLIEQPGYL